MTTILCVASYFKGSSFIRECKALGCRVLLLTASTLKDADWPHESLDDLFLMPDLYNRDDVIKGVSWLVRSQPIDRIVPLDEFDLEMVAALREHLRIPGMGETTVRYFRDKLAMRVRAEEAGIRVPPFVPILNHQRVREYLDSVPPPWVLKPRFSASAIGIKKVGDAGELWRIVDELGDDQSQHLLEQFVPGDIFHVDAITWAKRVRFAEASGYLDPPFAVYHGGGLFATRMLERGSDTVGELVAINAEVLKVLGFVRGVTHTEFIRGTADGELYFLETAARVGGASIVDMVEAATGVNLWREWARIEVANARDTTYAVPASRGEYAGLLISLARQEWPDTSAFADPEIVWRLNKRHHVGMIVASPDPRRIESLLASYLPRIRDDFHASMPARNTALD
ncbi:MAG: ATPase [Gemmatimonadaceae bacterium]